MGVVAPGEKKIYATSFNQADRSQAFKKA